MGALNDIIEFFDRHNSENKENSTHRCRGRFGDWVCGNNSFSFDHTQEAKTKLQKYIATCYKLNIPLTLQEVQTPHFAFYMTAKFEFKQEEYNQKKHITMEKWLLDENKPVLK